MSTHYEFTVSPEGKIPIVLPEEYRGKKFKIVPVDEDVSPDREKLLRILKADAEFRHPKTIEQLVEEQGVKPIGSLEELIPNEPAWESDEAFFEFLEAIGEDVGLYR